MKIPFRESNAISIFESCVPRDLFCISLKKTLRLEAYIARQTVISAISTKLDVTMEDIHLDSKFQKIVVCNDVQKTAFAQLKQDKRKWIIVDFIDGRFVTMQVDNTYIM